MRQHSFLHRPGLVFLLAVFATAPALTGCASQAGLRKDGGSEPAQVSVPMPPTDLRVEYRLNPLGIDVAEPRFSWVVNDPRRGAVQAAWQVRVSTEPSFEKAEAIVWDSGRVTSDESVHVPYSGPALTSSTRYFWTVRTWDAHGIPSPFAHTGIDHSAWWETALMNNTEFDAKWIGPQEEIQDAPKMTWGPWIWCSDKPEQDKIAYFRLSFELPAGQKAKDASIRLTADDELTAWCNGQELGSHASWNTTQTYDFSQHLNPGGNVIAIRAVNSGGPGALIATMRITTSDGTMIEHQTGPQWLTCSEAPQDWTVTGFDDSAWTPAVVVAQYGDEPWRELPDREPPRPSVCMRKTFTIDKPIKRARAYASGLGIYEMHLNGHVVGNDVFAPGWTHYYKRIQYQTYDITHLVTQGANAVGMLIGNGWWSGGFGWHNDDQYSAGGLRCIVQLHIEHPDGTTTQVITDPTWTSHGTPIVRNTFYHGETHDARLEMLGWDTPDFDDAGWLGTKALGMPTEMLVAQYDETIQVTEEIEPVWISAPEEGAYIIDFGQNASGRVRMNAQGPPGHKITLRFGEELDPEGKLYRRNYRSAQATDEYICRGQGIESWEPVFTYRGFRYCEVTGWPQQDPKKPQPPTKDAFTMRVLHSAPPRIGRFESSNWLLNRIYENIVWGQRSNMHSVPTDCPQRDERLGWMGDAQTFGPTACWNMQMGPFFSKWLKDIDDSRSPDGAVTDVAPTRGGGVARPGWGDAVVIVPWTMYQYFRDKRILEENYEQMAGWVDYMTSKSEGDLYEVEGYGDWVPAMGVASPKKPIGSAYYYYSTKIVAQTAEILGRHGDAGTYLEQAERTRKAFNERHLNPETNSYTGDTQTANILPLWFGITPDERRAAVAKNIADDVKAHGYHLTTGFLGTAYLMPLLTTYGYHETAWKLATQTSQPSLGYMATHGATTVWELWDTDKQGPNMNSRNHFCFGVVGQWYYEAVAGLDIDPDNPGFKHIIIRPRPMGDLLFARCVYRSLHGGISVHWRRPYVGAPELQLSVIIPANTTATVYVPKLDNPDPIVMEMGTMVFTNNGPAQGRPGVEFLENTDQAVVFEIGAGAYVFSIMPGGEE